MKYIIKVNFTCFYFLQNTATRKFGSSGSSIFLLGSTVRAQSDSGWSSFTCRVWILALPLTHCVLLGQTHFLWASLSSSMKRAWCDYDSYSSSLWESLWVSKARTYVAQLHDCKVQPTCGLIGTSCRTNSNICIPSTSTTTINTVSTAASSAQRIRPPGQAHNTRPRGGHSLQELLLPALPSPVSGI